MSKRFEEYRYAFFSFFVVFLMLVPIQMFIERPMLLAERFLTGGGWITIFLLAFYAAFLVFKMQNPKETAKWRKRSWLLFSIVFFVQLALGLIGFEKFLMTGKLHFPIPALIAAGPLYRAQIGFMPILFVSTIILSGPAWCSHLCYFGSFDYLAALGNKPVRKAIKNIWALKNTILILVIVSALILRLSGASFMLASVLALAFGISGLAIIFIISPKMNKMYHCAVYCPIGTIIRYAKYINPFRMKIDSSCDNCMACITSCRYDALNIHDVKNRKPGSTCTYCGDCLPSCKSQSIQYRFPGLKPQTARILWIIITVSLHAVFMGLARI